MPLRFHVDTPLLPGAELSLPPGAARHVQVLRLQPGTAITLFDGRGGEWAATILRMGRSEVAVRVGEHSAVDRELPIAVTLAIGMPANERMDTLVEKATELGVAVLQPLHVRTIGAAPFRRTRRQEGGALAGRGRGGLRAERSHPGTARRAGAHAPEWLATLPAVNGGERLLLSPRAATPLGAGRRRVWSASAARKAASPRRKSWRRSHTAFAP